MARIKVVRVHKISTFNSCNLESESKAGLVLREEERRVIKFFDILGKINRSKDKPVSIIIEES